jgi:hypothetical protein
LLDLDQDFFDNDVEPLSVLPPRAVNQALQPLEILLRIP